MAVSKQPTITPETSSGEGLDEEPSSRGEAKWKRFHPFRVVRKIFRKRIKREGTNVVSESSKKSWSTSELQSVQDDSSEKCEVTSPLKIGLSVSHDSIFSPENNTTIVNNETIDVSHGSSLSVRHTSMKNMFKDELFTRIRARRDSDDDGIGSQNSPYSSPTTIDVLNQAFKERLPKSQTMCSSGSLISMGSSENDEDSTGQSSRHSWRMSLIDRRSLDSETDSETAHPVPLNHNAAHHKIAIRPKRNYGLPRRRMKQVAASKVVSLPSTPEVTEDISKSIHKFEINETISSATEFSAMSRSEIVSSIFTTEKCETSQSTFVTSTETSHITHESSEKNKIEYSKSHSTVKLDLEEEKSNEQNIKKNEIICSSETQKQPADNTLDEKEKNYENKVDTKIESKADFLHKDEISEVGSYINTNIVTEKSDSTCEENDIESNIQTQISVSSLIKNIEKSDSFKSTNKFRKPVEEMNHDTEGNYDQEKKLSGDKDNFFKDIVSDIQKENTSITKHIKNSKTEKDLKFSDGSNISESQQIIKNIDSAETFNLAASPDFNLISPECINELVKRNADPETLDIESEFVLKPLKKERNLSGDKDKFFKDVVSDKQKDNAVVSSVYLEEESIMSNKSLSINMEENRIVVSHETSVNGELKDTLVNEAQYVAPEEKSKESIYTNENIKFTNEKKVKESYISSVGLMPMNSAPDITFNSSICDKTKSEDKITISVNSNSDSIKSKHPSPKSNEIMGQKVIQKSSVSTVEMDTNLKTVEKQPKNSNKSHLPETSSSISSIKNINSQKRVSVEIVPFSQRMKERKYQPISFSNKDNCTESNKNPNPQIERKLSDLKVIKNEEVDKTNHRHSFSGALTMDSKKDEEIITDKKEVKTEKLQYPVQIRIHKSNPKHEIKDKNVNQNIYSDFKNKESSSDVKFQLQSSKVTQSDIKHIRDEIKNVDETSKWEIKIQPAVPHTSISKILSAEENTSVITQNNFVLKSESLKLIGNENKNNSSDVESVDTKSSENSWKSSKDTTVVSDDPEPELLRVFARRSIKQKHCDKSKGDEKEINDAPINPQFVEIPEKKKEVINVSINSTVIKISENSKSHITKPDLKKKSKSFCEKEKISRSISPLKEMNLIQKDCTSRSSTDSLISSDILHPRQRLATSNDSPIVIPPENIKRNLTRSTQNESSSENSLPHPSKEDNLHKPCSISSIQAPPSINGISSIGMVKENQEVVTGKEAHAPAWLQLAQQRREIREQRERLLLGGSPNTFMDGTNKPSRSSKVWDMVNNFQKLQMT